MVETVLGAISPDKLGITLSHEHLLFMCPPYQRIEEASRSRLINGPVRMENLGILRRIPHLSKDNSTLNDVELAIKEVKHFKAMGGSTIVENTVIGLGRDPLGLRKISIETGVNIIATTGFYTRYHHPPYVKEKTIEELSELTIKELTEGIGHTDIKAGSIGECGCSIPPPPSDEKFCPDEKKVLQAAIKAHVETECAYTFHPACFDYGRKKYAYPAEAYIDLIQKGDGDLTKFYLSHAGYEHRRVEAGYTIHDVDYLKRLLDRGINLSFDTFGNEAFYGEDEVGEFSGLREPTDIERVRAIAELCGEGRDKQLLLSQDVCYKVMLKKYGGWGYSHVLEHIVPLLRYEGVTKKQIRNMLIENPKKLFT